MTAPRPRPRPVPLADIAVLLGVPHAGISAVVTGIAHDSRSVQPGDLYAALPGRVTHGARFANAAARSGALAILTDAEGAVLAKDAELPVLIVTDPRRDLGSVSSLVYGDPAASLQAIGVTGTNGKTTVAAMVEAGLRAAGRTSGLIGTTGVRVDERSFDGVRTTPEATDLHAILGVMRDAGVESVVMEVSSIALDEHRVDDVLFDVVAFTNLSQDHLDYHGSMEAYFDAKARLFTAEHGRRGIVGVDDEWGRRLAARSGIPVETWSMTDASADWTVIASSDGPMARGPRGEVQRLDVGMPGSFNLANGLCALAVLRGAGVGLTDAAAGIASARVPGRMQVVGESAGVRGIVDYAHSPDAIERVLSAVAETTPGRVIAVVGAGGDRDRSKRPVMGAIAARLSGVLIVTDDNPRSEDPAAIRAVIREAAEAAGHAQVLEVADRAGAITVAVTTAETGDVVVVLGKGHEQGQESAGIITPFDDATVLADALRDLDHG